MLNAIARKLVSCRLQAMRHGCLQLALPDGAGQRFGDPMSGPTHALRVHRTDFFRRVLFAGGVGLGEAYVEGDIDCDDPTGLLELLIANRAELADGDLVLSWLGRAANRVRHLARRNTRRLSRRNIKDHYDLSNDFYRLFLDTTMSYSCALYAGEGDTLEEAQRRKLHRLLDMARVEPGHHVLEIGCGWGSFAIEAVRRTRCRVTAITLSEEQLRLARRRVDEAGLRDHIDVRLVDYREVQGRYDRIVSIEMLEAVGHAFLGKFFAACERLLKPDGLVALQVITMPDARYEEYRRSCDWIQKYIFPGGHLPSLRALSQAMGRWSRLHVEDLDNIGPHYARTLRNWRARFERNRSQIRALGFDERFMRMWRYYLCYCEAAFATRTLNTLQLVLTRPNNRQLLRDWDRAWRDGTRAPGSVSAGAGPCAVAE